MEHREEGYAMVPQLPQPVIAMMATREHRMAHTLWHGLREN